MKLSKSKSFRLLMVCIGSMGIFGVAMISASDKPMAGGRRNLRRIAVKFKGSEGTYDQNMEAQMVFQPGKNVEMKTCVKSGNKTYSLEMNVSSFLDTEPPWHTIEAQFVEQIGKAAPQTLHHPRLRTVEGEPVIHEIRRASDEGFSLEIHIEPIKQRDAPLRTTK